MGAFLRENLNPDFGFKITRIVVHHGTDQSLPRVDSPVPLIHHDPSDLGSKIRIRIFPNKRTLCHCEKNTRYVQNFDKEFLCNIRNWPF